jgi:hypothetical protein
MRTKTLAHGLKNSQKVRVIFKGDGSENDIGIYLTVKQMNDQFATVNARTLAWDALMELVRMRYIAPFAKEQCPTGLGITIRGKQIQIDLV